MAGERHGHGMLCVNRPYGSNIALYKMIFKKVRRGEVRRIELSQEEFRSCYFVRNVETLDRDTVE